MGLVLLALADGKFDFKRGWFDFVLETEFKEGQITGYAKPLFRNLKVFSLSEDLKEDNVLQFFWLALVGGATTVFKNPSRDQFGTLLASHDRLRIPNKEQKELLSIIERAHPQIVTRR